MMMSGIGNFVCGSAGLRVIGLNPQTGKPANPLTSKGFTLVEVLLAVSILALGMVGVLRAYAAVVTGLEAAGYSLDALCLLKEKMADIKREAIEEGGVQPDSDGGRFSDGYENFIWSKDIRTTELRLIDYKVPEAEGEVFLDEVEVTVANENTRPARRFSLVTYALHKQEEEADQ